MTTADGAARQAHAEAVVRFCHALDAADWPLLASLYTDDMTFVAREMASPGAPGPDSVRLEGREAFIGYVQALWKALSATHHMVSNHTFELGPDGASARGSCYLRAYHAGAGERAHLFEESLARIDFDSVLCGSDWKFRRWEESILIMLGDPAVFDVPT